MERCEENRRGGEVESKWEEESNEFIGISENQIIIQQNFNILIFHSIRVPPQKGSEVSGKPIKNNFLSNLTIKLSARRAHSRKRTGKRISGLPIHTNLPARDVSIMVKWSLMRNSITQVWVRDGMGKS